MIGKKKQWFDGHLNSGDGWDANHDLESGYFWSFNFLQLQRYQGCRKIYVTPNNPYNGHVDFSEECDDGNLVSGDGWDSTNKIELDYVWEKYTYDSTNYCKKWGNGVLDSGEVCDPGIWDTSYNGCNGFTCQPIASTYDWYLQSDNITFDRCIQATWGNGYIESGEIWDDGNTNSNDGWSSNWQNYEWGGWKNITNSGNLPPTTRCPTYQEYLDSLAAASQAETEAAAAEEEKKATAADNKAKAGASQATNAASFIMILQSVKDVNPSPSMWAFVNWIQIIRPMALLQTNITKAFADFLNEDMQLFSLQFPVIVNMGQQVDIQLNSWLGAPDLGISSSFQDQTESYNFEVGNFPSFLATTFITLFFWVIGFAFLYLIGKLLTFCKNERIKKIGNFLTNCAISALFCNLFIRFFQESILTIFLHCCLYIRFFSPEAGALRNTIGVFLTMASLGGTIAFVAIFSKRLSDPLKWGKWHKDLYDALVIDGRNVTVYFWIFFTKRFIITFAVALIGLVPNFVQNGLFLLSHITSYVLTIVYRPFENNFDQLVILMLELGGIFFTLPLFYFDSKMTKKRELGRQLIQLFTFFQILIALIGFAKLFHALVLKKFIKPKKKIQVQNEEDQTKVVEEEKQRGSEISNNTENLSIVRMNFYKDSAISTDNQVKVSEIPQI
jgi:cysteine-rich repeat protein